MLWVGNFTKRDKFKISVHVCYIQVTNDFAIILVTIKSHNLMSNFLTRLCFRWYWKFRAKYRKYKYYLCTSSNCIVTMMYILILTGMLAFNAWHFDLSHLAAEDRFGLSPIDIPYHPSSTLNTVTVVLMILLPLSWILILSLQCKSRTKIFALEVGHKLILRCLVGVALYILIFWLPGYFGEIKLNAAKVSQQLVISMESYGVKESVTKSWDKLQSIHDCCGVTNCTDWKNLGIAVPKSCGSQCPEGCVNQLIEHVKHELNDKAFYVWLVNFAMAILGCLMIVCLVCIRPYYHRYLEHCVARKTNATLIGYTSKRASYKYKILNKKDQ